MTISYLELVNVILKKPCLGINFRRLFFF